MAEQTNFYAVQRGAPWSFRPVSDGVINWYLYNFGSNLGVAFVERPSNLWVEMPWNCIFRVKNIVFSSGLRPPEPPSMGALYLHFRIFFLPLCPSLIMWRADASHGIPTLSHVWQQVKLSEISLGTRPLYNEGWRGCWETYRTNKQVAFLVCEIWV